MKHFVGDIMDIKIDSVLQIPQVPLRVELACKNYILGFESGKFILLSSILICFVMRTQIENQLLLLYFQIRLYERFKSIVLVF